VYTGTMASLRTREGKKKYQEYLKTQESSTSCPLCDKKPIKDFNFWIVAENSFPYDRIAKTHHLLLPKRHVSEKELTGEELEELASIKESHINTEYDWIIEATRKNKSIPDHFHLHLIIAIAN